MFGLLSQSVIEATAAVDRPSQVEKAPANPDRSLQSLIAKRLVPDTPVLEQAKLNKDQSFSEALHMATVLDPETQHLQEMREEIKRLREEQRDPERVLWGP